MMSDTRQPPEQPPVTLKVALCQIGVSHDKKENIKVASKAIDDASNAELIVLPEIWNSPYATTSFPEYAEKVPSQGETADPESSPSSHMLQLKAKELKKWIIGGSIPEKDNENRIYNTCLIFNDQGRIVGKYRKVHLFDIDVPGKIKFTESDSLSPGMTPTIVDTPWGGIGIGICYDLRFPEYGQLLRRLGARIFVYPGAFNMITGPSHWELLQRARAVDNQVFVCACSPARDEGGSGGYTAWGHSSVTNPWGEVIATTEHTPDIVFAHLDLPHIDNVRTSIPCWKQKREDVYSKDSSDPL